MNQPFFLIHLESPKLPQTHVTSPARLIGGTPSAPTYRSLNRGSPSEPGTRRPSNLLGPPTASAGLEDSRRSKTPARLLHNLVSVYRRPLQAPLLCFRQQSFPPRGVSAFQKLRPLLAGDPTSRRETLGQPPASAFSNSARAQPTIGDQWRGGAREGGEAEGQRQCARRIEGREKSRVQGEDSGRGGPYLYCETSGPGRGGAA